VNGRPRKPPKQRRGNGAGVTVHLNTEGSKNQVAVVGNLRLQSRVERATTSEEAGAENLRPVTGANSGVYAQLEQDPPDEHCTGNVTDLVECHRVAGLRM
jgi:hypothetical protein